MATLYIIATPIGNLGDITFRALEILKGVDLVACEDTRQTLKLLNHYQISKPLVSYFQHSKLSKIEYIAGQLAEGKNIALVTDAGTPGISDPGGKLVRELSSLFPERSIAESKGGGSANFYPSTSSGNKNLPLKIVPIPGPNAAIAALSVSGFPTDKFIFMGFPPHKKGRNKFFEEVARAEYVVVFYESTHRILKAMEQLSSSLRGAERRSNPADGSKDSGLPRVSDARDDKKSERQVVVCRELTKMFESVYRGTAEEILGRLNEDKNNQKGEFVVIIEK